MRIFLCAGWVAGVLGAITACGGSPHGAPFGLARSARGVVAARSDEGAWPAPRTIVAGGLGTPESPPGVAVDGRGDAVALWSDTKVEGNTVAHTIRTASGRAGGPWQASTELSGAGVDPDVSIDAAGDAVAVWQAGRDPFNVRAAIRPARGTWLPSSALSLVAGAEPQVASDPRGDAIAVWARRRAPTGIEAAFRPTGAGFEGPIAVSARENAHYPRPAMNARGDAVVAWEVDGPGGCIVRAAFRPAGGRWTGPRTLSDTHPGCPTQQQVAIDAHGNAIVAWPSQRGPTSHIEEVASSTGGQWSRRRVIASSQVIDNLSLAMDANGGALIVWSDTSNSFALNAIVRSSTGRWGSTKRIRHLTGLNQTVALDARGDALLAWLGTGIELTTRPVGRGWERPTKISRLAPSATPPLAVIDTRGGGFVAWQDRLGIETAWRRSLFYRTPRRTR